MRPHAWAQLGKKVPKSASANAKRTLKATDLSGWNVRKAPLTTEVDGVQLPFSSYAIVRDSADGPKILSPYGVSDTYQIVQNEDHTEFLDTLAEESGAAFDTAGPLDGGRRVFVSMKMPGHLKVGGELVENYISVLNSHDGSMAFTFMVTPIHVESGAVMNLAFTKAPHMFRVRHTRGAHRLLVAQAQEALEMTFDYLEGFQVEAEKLSDQTCIQQKFEATIARGFAAPKKAPSATVTRSERKVDSMAELFADHIGAPSAWSGLVSICEWSDHFSPSRGDDRDTSRAHRALLDPTFKNRALALMRTVK